ncbi:MAG: hypothetical protein VXY58_02960, partial [Bacteroidota bacterium]|nr:hypothetical protein [Bacteroidota bacterium]
MKLRTPIIWGAAGLIIALLSGCGASGTSLGKSNQRPYDFEAHILHPRCAVLPAGIDSVDVYLDWSREEALFLRDSPQSPFTANLQLKAGTFEVTWSDTLVDFAPRRDRKQWRVSLAEFASEWNQSTNLIPMQLDDLHRNATATWSVPLPQPGIPRTPFHSDGWPVHDGFAVAGDTLFFESAPGSRW